jgi:hypothetical protein
MDRKSADHWISIGGKRRGPLRGVLVILPAGFMTGNVFLGAVFEGCALCAFPRRLRALLPAGLDGVDAFDVQPAAFQCF